jgi:hypothetical protein
MDRPITQAITDLIRVRSMRAIQLTHPDKPGNSPGSVELM